MAFFKKRIRSTDIVDQLAERTAAGFISRARSGELLNSDPAIAESLPDLRQQREIVLLQFYAFMRGAESGLPKGEDYERLLQTLFKALEGIFVREGLFKTQDEFREIYLTRHVAYCVALDDGGKLILSPGDKVKRLSFKAVDLVGGHVAHSVVAALGLGNQMMIEMISTKKMFEGIRNENKIVE